jgi:MoxR-like ATPase
MAEREASEALSPERQALKNAFHKARLIEANISKVIVGKSHSIRLALVPLLCRGHLLLEDVPGVGKTTLAKALARSIDGQFRRIQFTPDLLPLDITGSTIYNQRSQEFEFREGPIFTNVLLADEINRATPRTQSSLLECMEEFQISMDGKTHKLPDVFFVIATENPVEHAGTFPLPETQLDRFMLRVRIGYPNEEEELQIFDSQAKQHPLEALQPVIRPEEIIELRQAVQHVYIQKNLKEYMTRIVRATREHSDVKLGASPRGTLSLIRGAQAFALLSGQAYVTPDIIKAVAGPVLGHRIMVKPHSQIRGSSGHDVVRSILGQIEVPIKADAIP